MSEKHLLFLGLCLIVMHNHQWYCSIYSANNRYRFLNENTSSLKLNSEVTIVGYCWSIEI